jgi:C4-type Zn-finger protein
MAKIQSFAEKSKKKVFTMTCPVCNETKQFVKHVKATKTESGSWKFRSVSVGVCKCNTNDIYV